MASFLPLKPASRRDSNVFNGGLGGCVQTAPGERYYARKGSFTGPLRRKRPPPSVEVSLKDQNIVFNTMTPTSVVLHDEMTMYGDFGNPFNESVKSSQLEDQIVELLSPVERGGRVEKSNVFVNRPLTPPTPQQTTALPVELPGSILLPSQGFPQKNPPVTPARDSCYSQNSEQYRRSPTPSLDSSSSTDGEMDLLKHLTSPQKRSGRSSTFPALPVKNASRAFAAMSADELMECLPNLNMSVVSHSWLPAMETELQRIKALLQEAAETRLQSQTGLENLGSDINSLAVSARDISRIYFDVLQRVRPLAARDAKAIKDQLAFTQAELETAKAVMEENKKSISNKEDVIQRLHETIAANARTFGGFIQDHVGSRLDNLHDVRIQQIKQLIGDQQRSTSEDGTHTPSRYVRIPEQQYNSYLDNLHNTQQQVETYSKIANEQLELIKSQSADLDKRMEGYGECLTILERRHNRIVELESTVEANEKELKVAKETTEAYRNLREAHGKLEKHCTDLDWTLQSLKNGFKKQLDDRDTEIFALRQQLGDAVIEAATRKADARTAISQPETTSMVSRFRNPLHFGRCPTHQERDLPILARRKLLGRLPASQSMLSLNTSQANLGPENHPAFRNTPSPLSESTRPSVESPSDQGSGTASGRLLSGLRMNPPETSGTSIMISPHRPRKDSLPKSARSTRGVGSERPCSMLLINREKALPTPPILQPHCASPNIHLDNPADHDPIPSPSVAIHTTPHNRRILSGITERSFEDAEMATPTSTSSSDKNAFRSSMAILDRFESADTDGEAGQQQQQQQQQSLQRAEAGAAGDEIRSPVKSARELYHRHGHGLGHKNTQLRRGGKASRRGRGVKRA